ncbi:hypothetical protein I4U23_001923 [Adineta vaga]|nr:hypothetical protein I4U23_001923 [Adineta vaga]
MYAPPPAAAPGGAARSGLAASGPILAICCLLFILFLIASTIVLALIPVYLSTRDSTSSSKSSPYTLTGTPGSIIGEDRKRTSYSALTEGSLDSSVPTAIANAMISALSLQSGSVLVDTCLISSSSSRKRRGFGLLREYRDTIPKLICLFRFEKTKCTKCGASSYLNSIKSFTMTASHKATPIGKSASIQLIILYSCVLSTSTSTATGESPSYLLTADPTAITDTSGKRADYQSFDADQELDSDSRTNTANAVISTLGLSSGAFLVDQCRTAYTTSRKRRGFDILREARATNGVKLFCKVRFDYAKCGRCSSTSYLQSISNFAITATQSIKISGESSVPKRIFTYSCKLTLSDAGYPTSTSGFTGAVSG